MFKSKKDKKRQSAASPAAWKEALGNLPQVVQAVGQEKTTLSAQLIGLGSVSITAGDLVDGNWNKTIREDRIEENSMRAGVTAQYLAAISGAKNEAHGRAIGGLLANNTSTAFGSEDFFNRMNVARQMGGVYEQGTVDQTSLVPVGQNFGQTTFAQYPPMQAQSHARIPNPAHYVDDWDSEEEEPAAKPKPKFRKEKTTTQVRKVQAPDMSFRRAPGAPPSEPSTL
ncbi:hypothetical protein [Colletotrichum fructicola RNA virus 1]|nr:hypothetical protein [Colletotrichum fructicola RNA virus 1]